MSMMTLMRLLGGVGLFLFGIKLMGEALQDMAGDRLRRLIATLTKTPIRGVFVGALVTILIQSSSGTTVMTVSFVHAGLMTLKQAVGVIMGANIGTTVTAQLIAFKIKDYALPAVALGVALTFMGRSKRWRYLGNGLIGFGLLFLGMTTMEGAMSFLADRQDIFLAFSRHPLLAVLAGVGLTALVQASSATVGLTIAMASQGLLPLGAAIAILLGDNIGTTVTAVLASTGSSREAKQAAAAHVFFNVFGVVIFLLILPVFVQFVELTSDNIARQLANAHGLFNISCTLIFLPFTTPFVRFIEHLVPSKGMARQAGPRFLDRLLIKAAPAAAVDAVRMEMVRMGVLALEMLDFVREAFTNNDPKKIEMVNENEKLVNELNREITRFVSELGQAGLASDLASVLSLYANGIGDVERVGDHAQNLIELFEMKQDQHIEFSQTAMEEFVSMFDKVRGAFAASVETIRLETMPDMDEVDRIEDEIDNDEKTLRKRHIGRLNAGVCSPSASVIFIDILSNLERIGDHSRNLALGVSDVVRLREGVPIRARA